MSEIQDRHACLRFVGRFSAVFGQTGQPTRHSGFKRSLDRHFAKGFLNGQQSDVE